METSLYTRLSAYTALTDLVGTNIYPTVPTENTQLPFVVYRVTSSEPQLTTEGAAALTKYAVQIDTWAVDLDTVLSVLVQTKAALHLYQGGSIHRAFMSSQSTEEADDGFHGLQTYTVWGTALNLVALSDDTSTITTGSDFIELEACDHVLRLDCDGLTLDGGAFAGGVSDPLVLTTITAPSGTPGDHNPTLPTDGADLIIRGGTGGINQGAEGCGCVGGTGGDLILEAGYGGPVQTPAEEVGEGQHGAILLKREGETYLRIDGNSGTVQFPKGLVTDEFSVVTKGMNVFVGSDDWRRFAIIPPSGTNNYFSVETDGRVRMNYSGLTDPIGSLPRQVGIKAGTTEFGFVNNGGEGFISATNGTIHGFGGHINNTDGVVFGAFTNHATTVRANGNKNRIQCLTDGRTALGEWTLGTAPPTTTMYVYPGGGIKPARYTDAAAPNDCLFYSTTSNKMAYKDSGGVVNVLY